jgi:hypothetical protein
MKTLRCTAGALVIRDLPSGADTGKRIIHGQTVSAYGKSYDGGWAYITAPGGSGWSSLAYLEYVPEPAVSPTTWPRVPSGLIDIRALYGEPAQPVCYSGVVRLPDSLPLAWDMAKHGRSFACHKLLEDVFTSAFAEVHRRGYWALLESFGGCYNDRLSRGLRTKRSTHAWGITVDVAVANNRLGAKPTLDPRIVAIFEDHGFLWGGRWSRPDGMHFQRATGY